MVSYKTITFYVILILISVYYIHLMFFSHYIGSEYLFTCATECSYYCPCIIIENDYPIMCNQSKDCQNTQACKNGMCSFAEEPLDYHSIRSELTFLYLTILFLFWKTKKYTKN